MCSGDGPERIGDHERVAIFKSCLEIGRDFLERVELFCGVVLSRLCLSDGSVLSCRIDVDPHGHTDLSQECDLRESQVFEDLPEEFPEMNWWHAVADHFACPHRMVSGQRSSMIDTDKASPAKWNMLRRGPLTGSPHHLLRSPG